MLVASHRHMSSPDKLRVRRQVLIATAAWRLTPRQVEVVELVVAGYTKARIGAELGISERTVEVHFTEVFQRARCCSRAELIAAVWLAS